VLLERSAVEFSACVVGVRADFGHAHSGRGRGAAALRHAHRKAAFSCRSSHRGHRWRQ